MAADAGTAVDADTLRGRDIAGTPAGLGAFPSARVSGTSKPARGWRLYRSKRARSRRPHCSCQTPGQVKGSLVIIVNALLVCKVAPRRRFV